MRVYETATEKEGGKTKVLSRQGRTILIERVDGKSRIGVAGEPPLDPKDIKELYEDQGKKSSSTALLPTCRPRQAGEGRRLMGGARQADR